MSKRVQFLLAAVMFTVILAACSGPLLGTATETYVNEKNSSQTLELTAKETLKGFIRGQSPNPAGWYTLFEEQKATTGNFNRVEKTYILKSTENQEMKITLEADATLRDETGRTWRLQSRSRSFRAPDHALASR